MDPATDRDEKTAAILNLLKEHELDGSWESDLNSYELESYQWRMGTYAASLDAFSDKLITEFHTAVTAEGPLARELIIILPTATPSSIHEHMAFRRIMAEATTVADTRMILRPLHLYPQFPDIDNYVDCDPRVRGQVEAIILITDRLHGHHTKLRNQSENKEWLPLSYIGSQVMISDAGLIELVMNNPAEAERIAVAVIERKTTDADLIRSIVTSSSKSLSNGVL